MPLAPPALVFDSPAIAAYLALVIALAVYLRTVSASLTTTIEALIANPGSRLWPIGSKHREDKIALLRSTRAVIQLIAPVVFVIAILGTARLLVWTLNVAFPAMIQREWVVWADIALAAILVVMITAMFIVHLRMSGRERPIREAMEASFELNDGDIRET